MLAALSVSNVTVVEDDHVARVTIYGDGTIQPGNIQYQTADDTAIAGQDYQATTGTIPIPAATDGPLEFIIPLINDSDVEPDEQFTVTISSVNGGNWIDRATGQVTISGIESSSSFNRDDSFTASFDPLHNGAITTSRVLPGGLRLNYNSLTEGDAIVDVRRNLSTVAAGSPTPTALRAELIVEGQSVRTIHYDPTGIDPRDAARFVFDVSDVGLAAGSHDWTLRIYETIGGVDRIIPGTDWATVLFSDGASVRFPRGVGVTHIPMLGVVQK